MEMMKGFGIKHTFHHSILKWPLAIERDVIVYTGVDNRNV